MDTLNPELPGRVLENLCDAPEGQISARLRDQVREFWQQDPKPDLTEQYDFLVILARTSCCESSSFVKSLCGLDKHYERPGGPREEPYPTLTVCCTPLPQGDPE